MSRRTQPVYPDKEELLSAAALLCSVAHGLQPHSGGLHTQHCLRVTTIVAEQIRDWQEAWCSPYSIGQILAACCLHDVPEDVPDFTDQVEKLHPNVHRLCMMVRNPSCTWSREPPPNVSWDDWRERQKVADAEHLKDADPFARLLKLGDRTDNCERAILNWDPKRCRRYAGETRRLFWPILSDACGNPYTAKVLPSMLGRLDRALIAMENLQGK